jgi:hypothetical protein
VLVWNQHTRDDTLIGIGTLEAVDDTSVRSVQPTSLEHLTLVLDQELDTLNGCRRGFGYRSRDTTHHEIGYQGARIDEIDQSNFDRIADIGITRGERVRLTEEILSTLALWRRLFNV